MFMAAVDPVALQIDALKLLKDWSSWLVSIQAAVLALLALWGRDKVQLPAVIAHWVFVFFGGSIIFATFVLGASLRLCSACKAQVISITYLYSSGCPNGSEPYGLSGSSPSWNTCSF
jgi:hypothetical protein